MITKKLLHKFQNLPPTPFPTLPILGHIHLLRNPNTAHRTLANLAEKHGPVINLKFGSRRVLLVSSASAAEDCLHHNDMIFASRPRLVAGKILGYNYTDLIWAPYGPLWRNHRKIASTEILSSLRLNLLADIRANEIKLFVKRISRAAVEGEIVEIKSCLLELTNNVMMRMIAGKRCYSYGDSMEESEQGEIFRMLIKEMMDSGPPWSAGDFFPVLSYVGLNSTEKKYTKIHSKMDRFFQDLVNEKRKEMEVKRSLGYGDTEISEKNKCLIEVLLQLHNSDPSYFTDDMIKGIVLDLLLAGTETTASTMEWALSLLLNNPKVMRKARKEIDDQVGTNRLTEESDINRLPYLHCIINETLRMYPATPILPPHENSTKCTVGGYNIPKGTMLALNIWAIHNDHKVWDKPRDFKPERFEGVKGEKLGHKFMPFGSGRRACPGENLAMRVVKNTLASLIQCFDLERVEDELVDMEETVGVTMMKAKQLQVKCSPRTHMIHLISSV